MKCSHASSRPSAQAQASASSSRRRLFKCRSSRAGSGGSSPNTWRTPRSMARASVSIDTPHCAALASRCRRSAADASSCQSAIAGHYPPAPRCAKVVRALNTRERKALPKLSRGDTDEEATEHDDRHGGPGDCTVHRVGGRLFRAFHRRQLRRRCGGSARPGVARAQPADLRVRRRRHDGRYLWHRVRPRLHAQLLFHRGRRRARAATC